VFPRCRKHAARCAEIAVAARTPQLKAAFLALSKNWENLAIQLENAFAQLADEALEPSVQESYGQKIDTVTMAVSYPDPARRRCSSPVIFAKWGGP
jgi:hypothetical protein